MSLRPTICHDFTFSNFVRVSDKLIPRNYGGVEVDIFH